MMAAKPRRHSAGSGRAAPFLLPSVGNRSTAGPRSRIEQAPRWCCEVYEEDVT
jgi:hypothetical protein